MARILIADDDPGLLKILSVVLRRAGHEVTTASNGGQALQQVEQHPFDLVITDLIMPGQEGLETIMALRKQRPELKIIAMSGGGRLDPRDNLALARRLGAAQTLAKPFSESQLLAAVNTVFGPGS